MKAFLSSFKTTIFSLFFLLIATAGWGQTTGSITIKRSNFTSGALAYSDSTDDKWTVTSTTGETITGFFDLFSIVGQSTMQTRTSTPIGSYPYNTIAVPGAITGITLTGGGTGTARSWTPYLSTTALTKSNYTSGTSQEAKTATSNSASSSWVVDAASGFKYFYLNMTGGAAYLNSIVITYEIAPTGPTLNITPAGPLNFAAVSNSAASATQDVNVTGSNLTGNAQNIVDAYLKSYSDTSTEYFEFSLNGSPYTNLADLPIFANAVNQTLKVRLKENQSVGIYTDKLILEYEDANPLLTVTKEIVLNATVEGPKLIATPATLAGFAYEFGAGPSTAQSFVLKGQGLNGTKNALLVPGDNWEISTDQTDWVDYASTLTIENYTGVDTTIYVRLKAGLAVGVYNNASNDIIAITVDGGGVTAPNVALSGTVTAPVISTSIAANGTPTYIYVEGNGPSSENSYQVSGKVLTADLVVTAPTNYEVSKTSGSGFADSVSFSPVSGNVASVDVFVRLKAGLVGASYTGNLQLSTTGIAAKSLTLTGSVTIPVPMNDLCANFINVAIDDLAITGILRGSTPSSTLTYAPTKNDVWYKFTTLVAGSHTITVNFASGSNIDFDVFTASCPTTGSGTFTAHSTTAKLETLTSILNATTTYYIRVIDFNMSGNPFQIRVTGPPAEMTVSETALSFGEIVTNSTSATQSFTVSATSLSPDASALEVKAPIGFEISTDEEVSWGTTGVINYTGGVIVTAPVSVRFKPTDFCQTYTGNITVEGNNAVTQNIAVSGSGILPASTATEATAITDAGFTANWTAVTDATGYELEVSTSPTFGSDISGTITEGFNGSDIAPSGWSFTGLGSPYTTTGNYGISTPSLKFDDTGDSVVTSLLAGNATELSFWLKGQGQSAQPNSSLLIEGFNGTGWITIANLNNVSNTAVTKIYNNSSSPVLPQNITQFRFTYTKGAGNIAFDDVVIKHDSFVPNFVTGYDPKVISGGATVSTVVTGLDQNTTYYYRVRAAKNSCLSKNSNVIEVKTLHNTTTFNGTEPDGWDFGLPNINLNAVINGDYTTTLTDPIGPLTNLVSKTLTINSGKTLTIAKSTSFTTGNFTNNGTLVVESDGNFVQTTGSINSGAGLATVKRNATMKRLDYTYWGSPVAGQMLKVFSPGTVNTRFLTYNSSDDQFSIVTDPTTTSFVAGKGYAIRASNYYPVWDPLSPVTADKYKTFEGVFTGMPHNGNISIPLDSSGQGYNLVGNPYASNIDFNALATDLDIDGTAYFWTNVNLNPVESSSAYTGENYASYNSTSGGVPATGQNLVDAPKRYIKVGQGFIVKAKSGGDENLTFTNAMRNDGTGSSNFMNRGTAQADLVVDRFWLTLTTPAQNFNTILIAYPRGATNGYDTNADAQQMGQSSDSFYSQIEDKKLNIQGRQFPLINTDVVSLGMKGFEAGTYKIAMIAMDGVFAKGQKIYLKDKQTNTIINLSEESYTFVASEGLTEGRFEIVYQTGGVLQTGNVKRDELIVYKDGNGFVVKSTIQKISAVDVYDTSGRLVLTLNPNQMEITIDSSAMINGVYILKINRGAEVSRKKIIK